MASPNPDNPPGRTEVRFSRGKLGFWFVVFVGFTALGLWMLLDRGDPAGLFPMLISIPAALLMATRLVRSEPCLVLSDSGLQLGSQPIVPWSELDDESIHTSHRHVILDLPNGRKRLPLQQLDLDGEVILAVAAAYRRRSRAASG